MSFDGADGTFGYVATMDVGEYQLVCSRPYFGDVSEVFLAGFVVEDLMIDDVAARLEAGHDAGVGRYAVAVFSCMEGLDEDGVCIAVVGHHKYWLPLQERTGKRPVSHRGTHRLPSSHPQQAIHPHLLGLPHT